MLTTIASLKAVADDIRVRILLLLAGQEACVCELMAVFGMAQSKLSHHLIMLRDAGLLQADKRGKWNYYRVEHQTLSAENRKLLRFLVRSMKDDATVRRDRTTLARVRKAMGICC